MTSIAIKTSTIIYLDDEPDWLNLVQIELDKNLGLPYEFIPLEDVQALDELIWDFTDDAILILDLKLVDLEPEHDGLEWLTENIDRLRTVVTHIIIFSGNLQPPIGPRLGKIGISKNDIFRKEPWDRSGFTNRIRSSIIANV